MRLFDPHYVAKPWGVKDIRCPADVYQCEKIGEIWYSCGAPKPTMVKRIFTSENLSVQVHPDDRFAQSRGFASGKTECWFITNAEYGARLAAGTVENIPCTILRQAVEEGSVCELLQWHDAKAGDFFYIPAGTIHAIGGGIELIEVQQNVDLTYRLYDYGRGRDLHLEDGFAVVQSGPLPISHRISSVFSCDRSLNAGTPIPCAVSVKAAGDILLRADGSETIICVEGQLECNGDLIDPFSVIFADPNDVFSAHSDCTAIIVP